MSRMTVDEMIHVKRDLTKQLGGHIRGNTELRDDFRDLGRALDYIADMCKFHDQNISFAPVVDQAVYRMDDTEVFGRRMLNIDRVFFGGYELCGHESGGRLLGMEDLEVIDQNWRWATSGKPQYACYDGANRMRIHCPPSETYIEAGKHSVSGYFVPGLILPNGTYIPKGFEPFAVDSPPDVTEPVEETFDSYALSYTSADLFTTVLPPMSPPPGFRYVDGYTYNWLLGSGSSSPYIAGFNGFDFSSIPSDATITSVRLKKLVMAGDVSGTVGVTAKLKIGLLDGLLVEASSSANLSVTTSQTDFSTGLALSSSGTTWAELNNANFCLQLTVTSAGGVSTLAIDQIVIEVTYTTEEIVAVDSGDGEGGQTILGGTGSVFGEFPTNAYLDIRDVAHYAFAVLSAVLATTHNASDRDVVSRMQALDSRAFSQLEELRIENLEGSVNYSPSLQRKRIGRRWPLR